MFERQAADDEGGDEVTELRRVVASQRQVIAQLQAERDADHATIDRLSAELSALLRGPS